MGVQVPPPTHDLTSGNATWLVRERRAFYRNVLPDVLPEKLVRGVPDEAGDTTCGVGLHARRDVLVDVLGDPR